MTGASEATSGTKTARGEKPRIVFLTSGGELYWIIANALAEKFGPLAIIQEQGEPRDVFLKRRIRMLGHVTVAGQVAFGLLSRFICKASLGKHRRIISAAGANADIPAGCPVVRVPSVNSEECRRALEAASPDVVMVVGTRIIGKRTLGCIDAPFINYHPGLTPKYRGMNGAYWTLANGDSRNLAVTVHLVDEGVDTGDILYQERVVMPPGNNIMTYHHAMAVEARRWVVKAVGDVLNGRSKPWKSEMESRQWFHPTLWGYLWTGLARRVW